MVANLTSADSADKYPNVATSASKLSVVIALAVRVSIFPSTACSDVMVAYFKSAESAVINPKSPIRAVKLSMYALSAVKSLMNEVFTFSKPIVASAILAPVSVESLILEFSIVPSSNLLPVIVESLIFELSIVLSAIFEPVIVLSAILLFVITPSLKIAPSIVPIAVPLACAIVPLL